MGQIEKDPSDTTPSVSDDDPAFVRLEVSESLFLAKSRGIVRTLGPLQVAPAPRPPPTAPDQLCGMLINQRLTHFFHTPLT